jgi:PAS domain S-box-containing protein
LSRKPLLYFYRLTLNFNESSLNRSVDEKLFTLLVASVKDYAIYLIDTNGHILSWNEGAQHIKGYRADEVIGRHISIFYLNDDAEKKRLRHNLNQALKKGMHECEGWRVKKDGTMFWANTVFTTVYNDDGHLIGFAKVTRDFTERKELEEKQAQINTELERRVRQNTEQIVANELRFRKLIENSYEGISLFDKDLKVFYRSPSSERINGWQQGEREATNALAIVHPDDQASIKAQFKELLRKPAENFVFTCRILHQQGHYIWVECIFTNMLHDESIAAIVCNFRDITHQKNAELESEKITLDLVQRNKDLEQFAYIISHNLRAPVANITGLANLLQHTVTKDQESAEILRVLTKSVRHLDEVIIDLNHILQVNNEANDKIETVTLPNLIKEIQIGISSVIKKNEATLKCNFNEVDKILSLKGFLYSIFQNLIINSIKYHRPGIPPLVTIRSELKDDHIFIYFKDNGKGIDLKKFGNQMFGLYKQFDQSVKGKGIGLFMVKMQMDRLGGSISVESELNIGTVFTLKFPATSKASG